MIHTQKVSNERRREKYRINEESMEGIIRIKIKIPGKRIEERGGPSRRKKSPLASSWKLNQVKS